MSMIAKGAGVAAGTIYIHFESKDHLMQEACKELERQCLSTVMKNSPSSGSIRQRFFHLAHRFIDYYIHFEADFLFIDQFFISPYRKSHIPSDLHFIWGDSVLQFFHEGVEKQIFKDLPPAILTALAFGPLLQVLRADVTGNVSLNHDLIDKTIEACWEIVGRQERGREAA